MIDTHFGKSRLDFSMHGEALVPSLLKVMQTFALSLSICLKWPAVK
jgi:hypothetical protein